MKRLTLVVAIVAGLIATPSARIGADDGEHSVTGAATGVFGAGAELGAVALERLEIGTGVFIAADGSASGTMYALLQGSSLGIAREITLAGNVSHGAVEAPGRATFSGVASLDLGDGGALLQGIAFSLTASGDGLVLAIDSTALPTAALTGGVVTIE